MKETVARSTVTESTVAESTAAVAAASELPDFDTWWNYDAPADTERKFRELLSKARAADNADYLAELLTQIARTEGLQGRFEQAHQTLNEVEAMLGPSMKRPRIRCQLERGRVFNSAGQPEKARPLFLEAWELGRKVGEDAYAIDAAHMMGIVESGEKSLAWNFRALEMAEHSRYPKARKWRASLYNNIGWTYHDRKQYDRALEMFQKALACRQELNQAHEARIAKWCVGRALRSLDRVREALQVQQDLLAEYKAAATEPDGYLYEEVGECLLALKRSKQARPHFAKAYEMLSKDNWLVQHEPERIKRLQELGSKR